MKKFKIWTFKIWNIKIAYFKILYFKISKFEIANFKILHFKISKFEISNFKIVHLKIEKKFEISNFKISTISRSYMLKSQFSKSKKVYDKFAAVSDVTSEMCLIFTSCLTDNILLFHIKLLYHYAHLWYFFLLT